MAAPPVQDDWWQRATAEARRQGAAPPDPTGISGQRLLLLQQRGRHQRASHAGFRPRHATDGRHRVCTQAVAHLSNRETGRSCDTARSQAIGSSPGQWHAACGALGLRTLAAAREERNADGKSCGCKEPPPSAASIARIAAPSASASWCARATNLAKVRSAVSDGSTASVSSASGFGHAISSGVSRCRLRAFQATASRDNQAAVDVRASS